MELEAITGRKGNPMNQEFFSTISKGATGVFFSAAGIAGSFLEQLEQWMRIGSLALGMAVAVVTIWSILRKKK